MLIKFMVKDFLEEQKFKNRSKKTIANYSLTLEAFQSFCADKDVLSIEEVTPNLVKAYLLECREKGNSSSTINTKIAHLKSFFNYLVESEYLKASPMKRIKKTTEEKHLEPFTDEQIRQIFAYFRRIKGREKTFFAYRDYVLISFLLGSMCRIGEVSNLKWADVDLINGSVQIFGKGRRVETVPIPEKLCKELSQFKVFCEKEFKELPTYVFPNRNGEQSTPNSLKLIMKRLSKKMGFKVHAHKFRRTGAKMFLLSGGTIASLQAILRHKDVNTTMIYGRLWGNMTKSQMEEHNPLNRIDSL